MTSDSVIVARDIRICAQMLETELKTSDNDAAMTRIEKMISRLQALKSHIYHANRPSGVGA